MKITLINPPLYDTRKSGGSFCFHSYPPVGLSYIGAYMKKNGHDVSIHDLYYKNWAGLDSIIKEEKPDIVGITSMSDQRSTAFETARRVKQIDKNIIVVMGGIHASFMYEQILKNYPVDYIVIGEGELTFLELVKAIEAKSDFQKIKGIAFNKQDKVIKTGERERIESLDSLPFPELDIFDVKSYPLDPFITNYLGKEMLKNLLIIKIIPSRGCPSDCQFCSSPAFWGRKWRVRSTKNVVDEIENLHKKFNCNFFSLADEIFAVKKERAINFCRELLERKLNIFWDCETRVDAVDIELLNWMKKANCYKILYGVESGSRAILKNIKKNISIPEIENAIRLTKQAGILTHMLLIAGNPGESSDTINETYRLIKKTKPDFVSVSPVLIFPGTELYSLAKSKKFMEDDYWLTNLPIPYYTAENSLSQILSWRYKLWKDYMPLKTRITETIRDLRERFSRRTGIFIGKHGITFNQYGIKHEMIERYRHTTAFIPH